MASALKALTLRLDQKQFRRLAAAARAENRSPTNYVETLVLRDLEVREEADRVLTVYTAPELVGKPMGELHREENESDERYEERKKLVAYLWALGDKS